MSFSVFSPAFPPGGKIPRRYTLDGDNLSPPLEWRDPPAGTKSFALMVEDPDAPRGTFRHWGLYNIGARQQRLPEGVGESGRGSELATGINGFGHSRYDGPRPPRGDGVHHYHFRLAALDVEDLIQPPKALVEDVWAAAEGHILAEAEVVGTYQR
jgi:Raf kinase inhibitor-like YbhB/YbcL family protein